jgi:hypothetical protein
MHALCSQKIGHFTCGMWLARDSWRARNIVNRNAVRLQKERADAALARVAELEGEVALYHKRVEELERSEAALARALKGAGR